MTLKNRTAFCVYIGCFILLAALGVGLHLASAHQNPASSMPDQPAVVNAPDLTQDIELIGHMGGNASAIDVNERYIAAAYKGGFELISITDPALPRDVAFLTLPSHLLWDGVLDGDYAYITYGESDYLPPAYSLGGLYIIDISDPTTPVLVGDYRTDEVHQQVVVKNQHAYVTKFSGLSVLDVSNPSKPIEEGYLSGFYGNALQLFPENNPGNHIYACATDGYVMHIIDLTDHTQPEIIGSHRASGSIVDVAVNSLYYDQTGNIHLYLTQFPHSDDDTAGIEIVDATNPSSPTEIMTYDPTTNYYVIEISGNYAYVSSEQGLHILDISNPITPQEIGTYAATRNIFDIAVRGGYLFIADFAKGLYILDVSEPSNPVTIAAQEDAIGNIALVAGHYAYTFNDFDSQDMQVWDVLNPVASIQIGSFPIPECCAVAAATGNYALFGENEGNVWLFDISDPSLPTEVSIIEFDQFRALGASGIAVKGEIASPGENAYAYITSGDCWTFLEECVGFIDIFDLSDPLTPTWWNAYSMLGAPVAIHISDPYAFIASFAHSHPSYLAALDITAVQPSLVTTVTINGSPYDMSIFNMHAYIAMSDGLSIFDISDPASLVEVGRYEYTEEGQTQSYLSSVIVEEGFTYLADMYNSILVIIDISDPTNPQEVARLQMPGWGNDLAISGEVIYASNGQGGISIYQHAPDTGRVRDVNGRPFSGVTIAVNDQIAAASGLTGSYDLSDTPAGTHTLSPAMQGYAFWPPDRTVELTEYTHGQNFTVLPQPVSTTLSTSLTTTLRYTDTSGLLTQLDFPPVPLPGTLTLVLTPTLSAGFADKIPAGHAFDMLLYQDGSPLPGFSFVYPVRSTIYYSRLNVRYIADESDLGLYWWDGVAWIDATTTCSPPTTTHHNLEDMSIGASFCQTGDYALFGPTIRKFLPLINR